jgi:hypothetical protein
MPPFAKGVGGFLKHMTIIPHQRAITRLTQITWNYWFRKRTVVGYPPYRLWIEPTNKCNLA